MQTNTTTRTAYLPQDADSRTGLPLLCFHHAGGAASAFAAWQHPLGPNIAVLPVQLPGRERRVAEPRFTELAELVADLDEQLDPLLSARPFAFYGHSMGGLVAYHLALRRARAGCSLPTRLLVGACAPPDLAARIARTLEKTDADLARWLVNLGGMSEELLRYPDWVSSALAVLRDDLRVIRGDPEPAEPLSCPIDVFAGAGDRLLPSAALAGWERQTTAGCTLHVVPGGHFFPRESAAVFFPALASVLSGRFSLG
jgi:surfactin synthase thioesterase subunit